MYVSDVFRRPLQKWARTDILDEFISFTIERDGEPDFSAWTLGKRDVQTLRGMPLDAPQIDQSQFDIAYVHGVKALDLDPVVRWVCALVRANEGESWGVYYHLRKVKVDERTALGQARRLSDLQEVYHARLLGELVGLLGLRIPEREPPWPLRQAIKSVYRMPAAISNMMMLGGEIVGSIAFLRMIEEAREVLSGSPATLAEVEQILGDILVDEIGHVTLLVSLLGGTQLRFAETFARGAVKILSQDYMRHNDPEQQLYRERLDKYSLNLFPEDLVRRAFVPSHLMQ